MHVLRQALLVLLVAAGVVVGGPLVASLVDMLVNRAEPSLHLLPADFEGPLLVVFGDPQGARPEYEDGARLYRIPASGVLRTQFAPTTGWDRPRMYRVARTGEREALAFGGVCRDSVSGARLQVCIMGRTYVGGPDGRLHSPEYQAFVVTRFADRDVQWARSDSLVKATFFR